MVLDVEFFVNQSSPQKHCRVCKKVASPLWEENLLDENNLNVVFKIFSPDPEFYMFCLVLIKQNMGPETNSSKKKLHRYEALRQNFL